MREQARIKRRDGFTFVELLVTVAIIAALAAIAIPLFFGQREKASASKAEQLVQQTLASAEGYYEGQQRHASEGAPQSAVYAGFEKWALEEKHAPDIHASPAAGEVGFVLLSENSVLGLYASDTQGSVYCAQLNSEGKVAYEDGKTKEMTPQQCVEKATALSFP